MQFLCLKTLVKSTLRKIFSTQTVNFASIDVGEFRARGVNLIKACQYLKGFTLTPYRLSSAILQPKI